MSEFTYCDHSDLRFVEPSIDRYDMKRVLPNNWVESGTSSLYYLFDTGFVDQLYKDGAEQTKVTDTPNANNEYEYDSGSDRLQFFMGGLSVSTMNSLVFEGGEDFDTGITNSIKRASDFVRSFAGIPIYKRKGVSTASSMGNDFPEVIVLATAYMACYFLIAPYDLEKADELKARATSPENTGLLDMIRSGDIHLYSDEALEKNQGIIREVSISGSSTGSIIDVRGFPAQWDRLKILITTGATLTYGSASSVIYDVFGRDSTGLKISKIVDGETLTGTWDEAGNGMEFMASDGVYTTNDQYELECNPEISTRTQTVKFATAERI